MDVVAIGETMLVFRPVGGGLLENARTFECLMGGAELNCLTALTRLGLKCGWISKLTTSPLSRMILAQTRALGIDTSAVIVTPKSRVGLMFLELGSDPRPNRVHYDRQDSACSTLSVSEMNWDYLTSARHLHVTGITPALSENCREVIEHAVTRARKKGMTVSLDANYRSTLWSEEQACHVLGSLSQTTDLLIVSREDAVRVLGCDGGEEGILKELQNRFKAPAIVLTLGDRGAAALWRDECLYVEAFSSEMKNRFGIGDAFSAGVIFGFLAGDLKRGLMYGAAMAALKGSIVDSNLPLINVEDVEEVVKSSQTQRTATGVRR